MKTVVALVTGGFTGEYVISLRTANTIEEHLDPERFEVYRIVIESHSWHYIDKFTGQKHEINRNNFTLQIKNQTIGFNIVFMALHGSPGEDGKLQGYFDMLNIPYTTCDATTSAITMNKGYTKAIVADIPQLHVARSKQLFSNTPENSALLQASLQLPYFVKPNNGGSSVGMSKVKTAAELPDALEKAFKEDNQVLVEEFIKGREFTIGVYKTRYGIQTLPTTEVITSKEFFDFEAKYTPGITKEITPGNLNEEELERVQQIATAVYEKLNCKGITRIDFILSEKDNEFYFIEINTVPGQTTHSFIPQQVRAAGMSLGDFYTQLIQTALADV